MRLIFTCTWAFLLLSAAVSADTADPCSPDVCKLPDCFCSGTAIPGNLSVDSIPQIVMITFDTAINSQAYSYAQEIFNAGIKNPNGCDIAGTFFVSHEYSNYQDAMSLRYERQEIADNTITNSKYPESWWAEATKEQWQAEIVDMKEILRKWGQVDADSVKGFRAPYIQVGGDAEFGALHDAGFLYESSMPTQKYTDPPMWPYTLDYLSTQECVIPPCPTGSFPGLWEVPLIDYKNVNPDHPEFCNFLSSCAAPSSVDDVVNLFNANFERHYTNTSNRAPFFMLVDAAWFATYPEYAMEGTIIFLKQLASKDDVYVVTISQAIEWIKSPTTLDKIKDFTPWKCDGARPPAPCSAQDVNRCTYNNGTYHVMITCTDPCPPNYPWTGNPDGN